MLWHSYFQYVQWLHVVKMFDVSQVVEAWCIFRMFCEKFNKIYLDKVLIFCFSEIMGWEVIVAYQEPITPKRYSTCGHHARITQRAIVIRATKLMVCQSFIFLPPRNNLQEKVFRRHMEFAIITILYLIGFLGVGFCFFQLAGILDRLTYQDQTIDSNKVWIWRSPSIIMEIE